jgi:beta-N-acetylhexosaminidase
MRNPLIISIKSTKLKTSEKNNLNIFKPYGVILFSRNISNFNQIKKLVKSIKSQSRKTLILIDQEGGIVNRFQKFPEFKFLDNYDYYKIYLRYPSLAKQLVYLKSFITSYYLKEIGIDINTIPVLDLPIHNTATIIKKRTFGPNIDTNIILNEVLLSASKQFGLIPVMKHIPGHGVTNRDSHFALPVSKFSISELNRHLKIFKHFNYLPLAMTAHIKYLSWDKNNIATFSYKIINQIIRKNVNFKG